MKEEFDPAIHRTKKDGTPLILRGRYIVDKNKAKTVDVAEKIMGSEDKTTNQIAAEVARSVTPAEQRLNERRNMPLSEDAPTYRNTGQFTPEEKPAFDYDINNAEELIKEGVAKRLGASRAARLEVTINRDDMTFHVKGVFNAVDSGTLKQPLATIVRCAAKVLTLRDAPSLILGDA